MDSETNTISRYDLQGLTPHQQVWLARRITPDYRVFPEEIRAEAQSLAMLARVQAGDAAMVLAMRGTQYDCIEESMEYDVSMHACHSINTSLEVWSRFLPQHNDVWTLDRVARAIRGL